MFGVFCLNQVQSFTSQRNELHSDIIQRAPTMKSTLSEDYKKWQKSMG